MEGPVRGPAPPARLMAVTFVGVRHHSPACARLVRRVIERVRPAYVLVEGPADFNDRIDELLLGHEPPIAIFSHYRDGERVHASWTPFCDYSPEWVAITTGRETGAQVRFIDLPAWHPAFALRRNRYADAEERYAEVTARLCRAFAVDNADTLWDHLFEADLAAPDDPTDDLEDLEERLATYFDLVRGESAADPDDVAREEYMARWVRAATAHAKGRPVVVVTGGFHRPALRAFAGKVVSPGEEAWPEVPLPPGGAVAGSYLVPYSFRRLDAFTGYQSGMPSPEYYQRLWEGGAEEAAAGLTETVVRRLRERRQRVSTADLIAARALTDGLARLRGHRWPSRTDLLDGLVAALITDDLERPLPWTARGTLAEGTHPVVVEMVAALSGDRVGRLRPGTPAPPLVHDATAELERLGLDREGAVTLRLADERGLARSRALHRLRVLGVPGFVRESGPETGADPVVEERWTLSGHADRLPALIEAGAYGPTLAEAASAVLEQRAVGAGGDVGLLAGVLFDAALCGRADQVDRIAEAIAAGIARAVEVGALGRVLGTVLGLWRHDRLLGTARSPLFGTVVDGCVTRVMWLVEGVRGGPAPADLGRLHALAAVRDAVLHAAAPLGLNRDAVLAVVGRISADTAAPPDLRGGAFGLTWSLGVAADPARAVLGVARPETLGDWLAGLFALARDEVLAVGTPADSAVTPADRAVTAADPAVTPGGDDESGRSEPAPVDVSSSGAAGSSGAGGGGHVLRVLDELISGWPESDFLVALPALRQAFEFFPPREREAIAQRLLEHRGLTGTARGLLRTSADPLLIAEAMELEEKVNRLLAAEGLIPRKEPA
ncbi:DUF5682 family protein [Thermopolyspora sp. NPDC052614]|uniref:DUF5682 family protein n=1 Tax=Thermopolyspora sp. NPDC052614 TaxID=3155682 RepID=UPI00342107A2